MCVRFPCYAYFAFSHEHTGQQDYCQVPGPTMKTLGFTQTHILTLHCVSKKIPRNHQR